MRYIGTCGFLYGHWREIFYPKSLKKEDFMEFYFKHFNSLEINSTFYKMPTENVLKKWKRVSKGKKLSIKVHNSVTHFGLDYKKANDFINFFSILQDRIGAFLFQLPASCKYNFLFIKNFIENLNKDFKIAIEFREKHWYNPKVYDFLRKNNIAMVWHDFNQPFVNVKTANFVYMRFHGYLENYKGSYPDEFLDFAIKYKKGFFYFNNTLDGSAIKDAKRLQELDKKN